MIAVLSALGTAVVVFFLMLIWLHKIAALRNETLERNKELTKENWKLSAHASKMDRLRIDAEEALREAQSKAHERDESDIASANAQAQEIVDKARNFANMILQRANEQAETATADAEEFRERAQQLVSDAKRLKALHEKRLDAIPWLAASVADAAASKAKIIEDSLRYKNRPAIKAANVISLMKDELRAAVDAQKKAEYMAEYYKAQLDEKSGGTTTA